MKAIASDIKDSPVAWFYTLEDARRQNDFERAARANQELERLGVSVRYTKQQKKALLSPSRAFSILFPEDESDG